MKSTLIILLAISLMAGCDAPASSDNTSSDKDSSNTSLIVTDEKKSDSNLTDAPDEETPAADDEAVEENVEKKPSTGNETDKKDNAKDVSKVKKSTTSADLPDLTPTTKSFSVDYLMGKFNPGSHPDFTTINAAYASKSGMHLRKDAYSAFVKMYKAAKQDGVTLRIISATRPFSHQKSIWEAKWEGRRKVSGAPLPGLPKDPEKRALLILQYSSMPGTSRHHWGTDIDLNDLNNSYFASGTGKKIYDWLTANASKFGYCQVYSPKGDDRPWGYNEEKWHWSYLPVAQKLTQQYKAKIKDTDISGFEGSETASQIGMIEKYVLGINKSCL